MARTKNRFNAVAVPESVSASASAKKLHQQNTENGKNIATECCNMKKYKKRQN